MLQFNPLFIGIRTAINCWQRDPWFMWQELQAACAEYDRNARAFEAADAEIRRRAQANAEEMPA